MKPLVEATNNYGHWAVGLRTFLSVACHIKNAKLLRKEWKRVIIIYWIIVVCKKRNQKKSIRKPQTMLLLVGLSNSSQEPFLHCRFRINVLLFDWTYLWSNCMCTLSVSALYFSTTISSGRHCYKWMDDSLFLIPQFKGFR